MRPPQAHQINKTLLMKISSSLKKSVGIILSIIILFSCNNSKIKNTDNQANTDSIQKPGISFTKIKIETTPENKTEFRIGEQPAIIVNKIDTIPFDSIQFYFENQFASSTHELPVKIQLKCDQKKTRRSEFEARIFKNGNFGSQKITFRFLSDIEPKIYSYEVVKVYPHERSAYTQGLVYEDGYFYESNGLKAESSLRKLQIGTGEPIQSFTLAPEIFAEGLTIMGDKIIQISWQNNTGFVYDKKSFQLLSKFSYTTEGWGLTNDGKNLIMSDGSNIIYFLDPQSYSEVSRIEVYDNKGPVNQLNELEYINGEIYANIYQTDKIARIDPVTGKVLAYIDLSKILNTNDYEQDTDVLNGIAYDPATKRLFVTGKKWPKLFEIKLKLKI